MLEEKSNINTMENEQFSRPVVENQPKMRGDIILVPQPSDDDADPLNWSQFKKYILLSILSLAVFASHVAALANQLGIAAQAELYDKSLNDISDTVSMSIAGLGIGPLLLTPLTHVFGCSSVLFWSMVGSTCCSIWSAVMTKESQYIPFILSRLFVGIFSGPPTILTPQILVNVFFLHERGVVFNAFMVCSSLGVVIGPTLGGFIVQHTAWPNQFWWTVALQGVVVVLFLLFLEETGYTRKDEWEYPPHPSNFVENRIATFFPGTRVAHVGGLREAPHSALAQILIGISPVTLLGGTFLLVMSGWFVGFNTLLSLFLQEPVESGGYGFSPQQNAYFTFTLWIGTVAAQIWGHFMNDRIPLYFTRRCSGTWKPEYRLHAIWFPSILMPISLALLGITFRFHLPYMVLAVECFMKYPNELNSILGPYRLGLGLGIPFFINAWATQVGVGWVFGIQALLSLAAIVPLVIIILYGKTLRSIIHKKLHRDEEGAQLIRKETSTTRLEA